MTVDEFINQMEKLKVLRREDLIGCTLEEIAELKKAQKVKQLPPIYIEFLSKLGKKAGIFGIGEDLFYGSLLELKEETHYQLEDQSEFILPDDAFIINMHHGYLIWYFRTEITNSPIFELSFDRLKEGSYQVFKDFSHFLEHSIELYNRNTGILDHYG